MAQTKVNTVTAQLSDEKFTICQTHRTLNHRVNGDNSRPNPNDLENRPRLQSQLPIHRTLETNFFLRWDGTPAPDSAPLMRVALSL